MVVEKSWDEFRKIGMLWWINRILHTFGWAIVYEIVDGKTLNVYPARVKYRGFSQDREGDGFEKISKYMSENAEELYKESQE